MKIEAALADGDDSFRLGQLSQCADSIGVAILRVVRMYSDRCVDMRMPLRDFDRAPIRLDGGNRAYRDDRADTRICRAMEDAVEVCVQLWIGQMAVRIDDRVHHLCNDIAFL